jgi:RNA polymerase sigma-70 factor (ECF subfamily)
VSRFARDPFADLRPLIDGVHGYVAYRIGPGADAEDVTSATFERALRYLETYDASKGEPLGWLIGIARRCIADHARSPRGGPEPASTPAPIDLETDAVRRLSLRAALVALDERDRELLALRYGADLSAAQIGRLAGMKAGAVRVALKRARERLAVALEQPPPDELESPIPLSV